MKKISLCMIVKNEQQVLKRCLSGIAEAVDEIIIVDTGSTDNTKQIASKFTNKIYDFKWIDDFSKARNYAFSKATMPYVMWLDADDVVEKQESEKIKKLKQTLQDDVSTVYMLYQVAFDEGGKPTFSYYRERLFKRSARPVWKEPIHEHVVCFGKFIRTDIVIKHKKLTTQYSKRNLKIFNKLKKQKVPLSTRLQYYYARELMYHGKYKLAITQFKKFLTLPDGWAPNKTEACLAMANCYNQLQRPTQALEALFKSFIYHKPTGEAMCKIAQAFNSLNQTENAIYWYTHALYSSTRLEGGFVQEDFYGYVPAINLCVLYYNKQQLALAEHFNNLAGHFKPYDQAYLQNKQLFKKLKIKKAKHLKLKHTKFNCAPVQKLKLKKLLLL